MRENIRKELEPGTSWRNGFAVRHIRSVTRSKTGLPTQIEYDYDYINHDTYEFRREGYYGSCLHSTFQDWVVARWEHDTHLGVWGEDKSYQEKYGDERKVDLE
jgi:hypothetical protein